MKKIVFFLFCILFFAPLAFGDEIDDNLPEYTPGPVKERTREMITAGIPSENALNVTRMMVQNRFRQEHTVRAQNAIMNAYRKEIPVEPIMNKIYEGIAKKVPDDIVVRAMEMALARYSFAYDHAKSITTNRDRIRSVASAITDSMTAGMLAQDIDRIIERLNRRSQVMERNLAAELALETFLVTRTMARMGVSSRAAADVVCEAHQHRYSVKEMKQFRNAFTDHATRANSSDIANQISRAVGRGEPPESLGRSENAGRGSDGDRSGGGNTGGGGSDSGGAGGSSGGGGSGSGGASGGSGGGGSGSGGAGGSSGGGGSGSGESSGGSEGGGSGSGSEGGSSGGGGSGSGGSSGGSESGSSGSGSEGGSTGGGKK